eukprot:803681-Alexandrium_andersonii.AAC.1
MCIRDRHSRVRRTFLGARGAVHASVGVPQPPGMLEHRGRAARCCGRARRCEVGARPSSPP